MDDLMIQFREADECVVHGRKFKNRMADCQSVHIDQQDFVPLQLQVFGVIITMDHVIVVRDILHECQKFFSGILRKVSLHKLRP